MSSIQFSENLQWKRKKEVLFIWSTLDGIRLDFKTLRIYISAQFLKTGFHSRAIEIQSNRLDLIWL